ncbi:hypothetical protein [Allosphingosinicella sp.]|uniref:phage terminase large subunit family protein n=1 Tax=Allosphingosinicella sp. TaxID=2823234 RepID=UPI002FC24ED3
MNDHDPPVTADGDECGIVACGLGVDGLGYVLGDHSAGGLSPEQWARKVAYAAETWRADRIVAEGNQGGEMVEAVLRGAGVKLGVTRVHARVSLSKPCPFPTWPLSTADKAWLRQAQPGRKSLGPPVHKCSRPDH